MGKAGWCIYNSYVRSVLVQAISHGHLRHIVSRFLISEDRLPLCRIVLRNLFSTRSNYLLSNRRISQQWQQSAATTHTTCDLQTKSPNGQASATMSLMSTSTTTTSLALARNSVEEVARMTLSISLTSPPPANKAAIRPQGHRLFLPGSPRNIK